MGKEFEKTVNTYVEENNIAAAIYKVTEAMRNKEISKDEAYDRVYGMAENIRKVKGDAPCVMDALSRFSDKYTEAEKWYNIPGHITNLSAGSYADSFVEK